MSRLPVAIILLLVLLLPIAAATGSSATPTNAGLPPVVSKILGLFDELRAVPPHHVAFRLTETEINDYLRYSLKTTPRPGLNSMMVKFFPHNYVSTYTIVDFDAVERWKSGTIPVLLRPVLSGQKSIWVDFRFQANNALVKFSVEKAYYGSIRLPAFFVEKMIEILAARQPEKYDTAKPLPIPFGLRQMWTEEHIVAGQS